MSAPAGLAVDTVNNEILVANISSITVYSLTASGNAAPLRTISGAATGLAQPIGLAVDTVNNEMLVANDKLHHGLQPDRGRQRRPAPNHQRAGDGIAEPRRPCGGHGERRDPGCQHRLRLGPESTAAPSRSTAGRRTAMRPPLRTISGAATGLAHPIGLAVDTVNNEILVCRTASSITVYSRTASGNVAAAACRPSAGELTELDHPLGLGIDAVNNEVLVANFDGSNTVTVYGETASGECGTAACHRRAGDRAERAGISGRRRHVSTRVRLRFQRRCVRALFPRPAAGRARSPPARISGARGTRP